jgi:hypothetical protein
MFKEMNERKGTVDVQNNTKNTKTFFQGKKVNISLDFRFSRAVLVPNPSGTRGMIAPNY